LPKDFLFNRSDVHFVTGWFYGLPLLLFQTSSIILTGASSCVNMRICFMNKQAFISNRLICLCLFRWITLFEGR
jgi:hypothetical protein